MICRQRIAIFVTYPVGPVRIWIGQQLCDACAVELDIARWLDLAELDQGGQDVDMGGDRFDVDSFGEAAFGPVKKEGNTMPSVVFAALLSTALHQPPRHRDDELFA